VEALQLMVDLVHKYKVAYLTTGFEHQNDFLAGRLGMIQGSSASLSYLSLQKIPFSMRSRTMTWLSGIDWRGEIRAEARLDTPCLNQQLR